MSNLNLSSLLKSFHDSKPNYTCCLIWDHGKPFLYRDGFAREVSFLALRLTTHERHNKHDDFYVWPASQGQVNPQTAGNVWPWDKPSIAYTLKRVADPLKYVNEDFAILECHGNSALRENRYEDLLRKLSGPRKRFSGRAIIFEQDKDYSFGWFIFFHAEYGEVYATTVCLPSKSAIVPALELVRNFPDMACLTKRKTLLKFLDNPPQKILDAVDRAKAHYTDYVVNPRSPEQTASATSAAASAPEQLPGPDEDDPYEFYAVEPPDEDSSEGSINPFGV